MKLIKKLFKEQNKIFTLNFGPKLSEFPKGFVQTVESISLPVEAFNISAVKDDVAGIIGDLQHTLKIICKFI